MKDVRRYLNEFLMDERVIDMPYLGRLLLVKGIIVPFRAPKSAHAYSTIWTERRFAPYGIEQTIKVSPAKAGCRTRIPWPCAMAAPAPLTAYDELLEKMPDMEEVVLVPLYPHYAMSSYETAVEYAKEAHVKGKYKFKLTIIPPYYDNQLYLDALAESMKPYLQQPYDHFLIQLSWRARAAYT